MQSLSHRKKKWFRPWPHKKSPAKRPLQFSPPPTQESSLLPSWSIPSHLISYLSSHSAPGGSAFARLLLCKKRVKNLSLCLSGALELPRCPAGHLLATPPPPSPSQPAATKFRRRRLSLSLSPGESGGWLPDVSCRSSTSSTLPSSRASPPPISVQAQAYRMAAPSPAQQQQLDRGGRCTSVPPKSQESFPGAEPCFLTPVCSQRRIQISVDKRGANIKI